MPKTITPWDDAILQVLKDNKKAMRYTEIADIIANDALRPANKLGSTPANTVNVYLHGDKLKDKVVCIRRGEYILKEHLTSDSNIAASLADPSDCNDLEGDFVQDSLITAYGRFWSRDMWEKNGKAIYGANMKTKKAEPIDVSEKSGIYLLHKGYEVIYVGQASQLNKRISDHSVDDKRNRWDNFSWFCLEEVDKESEENNAQKQLQISQILDTLEALLIETLGPERNKKVGNEFEDMEFEQIEKTIYLESKIKH